MPRMNDSAWLAWRAPILLGGLWCLLQWMGGPAWWEYDRGAFLDGQIWRLLSGHFVHFNTTHLLLNLLGLAGVMAVWREALQGCRLPLLFTTIALALSAGLWLTQPELIRYVGASGVLHGLFAAGVIMDTTSGLRFRLVAATALLTKLVFEPVLGGGTAEWIGATVIHAAHQLGAASGALIALAWRMFHAVRMTKGR